MMRTFSFVLMICLISYGNAFSQEPTKDSTLYVIKEEMPLYPGGDNALLQFVSATMVYPPVAKAKGITGRTYVGYWVEPDGSVGRVHVVQGSHPLLDKAGLEVIRKLKGYTPGYQNDKAVPVRFTIPLRFTLELPEDAPQTYFEQAKEAYKAGNDREGRKLLDKAISKGSDWFIDAYVKRAEFALTKTDYSKAQKDYEKALEIDPDRTDLWIGKAKCLYGRTKLNEAVSALEKAAKCNPYSSRALELMGDFLMENGSFSDAEKAFDRGIEISSHDGELFYKRANAKARQNKLDDACADWRQADLLKHEEAKPLLETNCQDK